MATKKNTNTYQVNYTKKIGGQGTIIVKAENETKALSNAKYSCFTGSDFCNVKQIDNSLYVKPSAQGFQGSGRQ